MAKSTPMSWAIRIGGLGTGSAATVARTTSVALLAVIALGSCQRTGPAEDGNGRRPHAISVGAERCTSHPDCSSGLVCEMGFCVNAYFQDENDGGDNYEIPGCHYSYTDAACAANDPNRKFFAGDVCEDRFVILEWLDRTCHEETDRTRYNCDEECKAMGKGGGFCVPVPDACGPGNHSARCECREVVG
jgi:hypothetical protein